MIGFTEGNCEMSTPIRAEGVTGVAADGWIELPAGKYRVDPENRQMMYAVCFDCPRYGRPLLVRHVPLPRGEQFKKMTGRCRKCVQPARRTRTGTVKHPSGAMIFYDIRNPEKPNQGALFQCANPNDNPNCLGKTYGTFQMFDRPTWRGLCVNCQPGEGRDHRWKLEGGVLSLYDNEGDPEDPGTQIFYRLKKDGRIPVRYRGCGRLHDASRNEARLTEGTVSTMLAGHRTGKEPWPVFCRAHFEDLGRTFAELLKLESRNGGEQKNGAEQQNGEKKKSRAGRHPKLNEEERSRLLPRFEELCEVLARVELAFSASHTAFAAAHPLGYGDEEWRAHWSDQGVTMFPSLPRAVVLRFADSDSPGAEDVAREELARESGYAVSTLERHILRKLKGKSPADKITP